MKTWKRITPIANISALNLYLNIFFSVGRRSSFQSCTLRVSSVPLQMMMTWQRSLIATSFTPFRLLPHTAVEAPYHTQVTMATCCPSKPWTTLISLPHFISHTSNSLFLLWPLCIYADSALGFSFLLFVPSLHAWFHPNTLTPEWVSRYEYGLNRMSSYEWIICHECWGVIRFWARKNHLDENRRLKVKLFMRLLPFLLFGSWRKQRAYWWDWKLLLQKIYSPGLDARHAEGSWLVFLLHILQYYMNTH